MRSHSRAGIGLGTTIKYLRHATSGAVDSGLDTSIKYLRCKTSGAAGNCQSRCQGLLSLHSPCLVRASFANKQSSTAEGWGLGSQCVFVEPELYPYVC